MGGEFKLLGQNSEIIRIYANLMQRACEREGWGINIEKTVLNEIAWGGKELKIEEREKILLHETNPLPDENSRRDTCTENTRILSRLQHRPWIFPHKRILA